MFVPAVVSAATTMRLYTYLCNRFKTTPRCSFFFTPNSFSNAWPYPRHGPLTHRNRRRSKAHQHTRAHPTANALLPSTSHGCPTRPFRVTWQDSCLGTPTDIFTCRRRLRVRGQCRRSQDTQRRATHRRYSRDVRRYSHHTASLTDPDRWPPCTGRRSSYGYSAPTRHQ